MELSKYHQNSQLLAIFGICDFAFGRGTARKESIFGRRTQNEAKKCDPKNNFHISYMMIGSQNIVRGGGIL